MSEFTPTSRAYPRPIPSEAPVTTRKERGNVYYMICIQEIYIPAHDPYFLRFILDIPRGARKKAQKSPARAFRALNVNQDSHRTPTTAATFL